jgi:hypothetical protein
MIEGTGFGPYFLALDLPPSAERLAAVSWALAIEFPVMEVGFERVYQSSSALSLGGSPSGNSTPTCSNALDRLKAEYGWTFFADLKLPIIDRSTFASDANFICDHPSCFRAALTCSPVIISPSPSA